MFIRKEDAMKRNHRVLWPALAIACLVLTALTFAASGKLRSANTKGPGTSSQPAPGPARIKRAAYVRASALSPKLVWNLKAMGDRLEKPGKERLSLTGTLTRANDSQAEEVTAVSEFPERLRLTRHKGNQTRAIAFDGDKPRAAANSLDTADQDLIETLVYGTAEHFLDGRMQGMAMRFLGSRFRLDDGLSPDYSGPY